MSESLADLPRYTTTQAAVEHRDAALCDAYYDAPMLGIDDAWDRAQSIAHDPDALDELQADGPLDYSRVFVKIDGQQVDLFGAADLLRLRIMAGRHAEADCIARDMTDALAQEIAGLLISGRL